MKKSLLLISILIIGSLFLIGYIKRPNDKQQFGNDSILKENTGGDNEESVEVKIEVLHFHRTRQCWSCITVGEYVLKTIQEKFPEEYENGTIIFKDINGELPENNDIVAKYHATGSSIFVNTIIKGQENIEEDANVWLLVTNEERFIDYFENKLRSLLDKT